MYRFRHLASTSLVTLGCMASVATDALALPGDLDPSFGIGGQVITDFGGGEQVVDAALQPDGKIVAAGGVSGRAGVARYNPDGSLDPSFSADGLAIGAFGAPANARAVAVQPDGKIVTAGSTAAGPAPENLALVRFNPDGSLDAGFDGDGLLFTDLGQSEFAGDLALQPDGGIVVAATELSGGPDNLNVVRYSPSGALDAGFGAGGIASINLGGEEQTGDIALQPDGKIVVTGVTISGNNFDSVLLRLNPDGSLDGGFDGDGVIVTDRGGAEAWGSVTRQSDGRIVVGGFREGGPAEGFGEDGVLARYNPDGSLDPSFGSGGFATFDFGSFEGIATLAVQPDDKLLLDAGAGFSIARLTAAGALDPEFGIGGRTTVGFGGEDFLSSIVVQADGGILAAGDTRVGGNLEDFALARFAGGDPPPPCRGRTATIVAAPGSVTRGTAQADVIAGSSARDRIKSGKGRDLVCALGGKDLINTGAGNDFATGGKGRDTIRGGRGRDLLRGNGGNDTLVGGGSRDTLVGGKGKRDRCVERPGNDRSRGC